jgi:hypothetical protein
MRRFLFLYEVLDDSKNDIDLGAVQKMKYSKNRPHYQFGNEVIFAFKL